MFKGLLIMAVFSVASITGVELTKPSDADTKIDIIEPMMTPKWVQEQTATEQQVVVAEVAPVPVPEPVVVTPTAVSVTVTSGDTLSSIAERHQTTYRRLFDANPSITNPNTIEVGQTIQIPLPDEVFAVRELPVIVTTPVIRNNAPSPQPSNAPAVASGSIWDQLALCESGGNWSINTGNGYYGGLQFSLPTWRAVGGSGLPSQNSREEQIARAEILLARSGWGQWPACSSKLGLR